MQYLTFTDEFNQVWGVPIHIIAKILAHKYALHWADNGFDSYHSARNSYHMDFIDHSEAATILARDLINYGEVKPYIRLITTPNNEQQAAWEQSDFEVTNGNKVIESV